MDIIYNLNIQKVKNEIASFKEDFVVVRAQNLEFNRKILEYGKFDVLLDIHFSSNFKDRPKQLDSGLNHVLARIAAKNKVSFGIDLEKIRLLKGREKAEVLARIRQNIKMIRKAGAGIKLINYKDKYGAKSFLISLGASSEQLRDIFL